MFGEPEDAVNEAERLLSDSHLDTRQNRGSGLVCRYPVARRFRVLPKVVSSVRGWSEGVHEREYRYHGQLK